MCAACVAQGVAYVGGAVVGLRVWSAHRRSLRAGVDGDLAGIETADATEAGPGDGTKPAPVDGGEGYRLASLSSQSPTTVAQSSG